MERYSEVSDETKNLFREVLEKTSIPRSLKFETINDSKSKQSCYLLKINDMVKHITTKDMVFSFNEELLDLLTTEQKMIKFEEVLCEVFYDMEADKIKFEPKDFNSYSSIMKKYGSEKLLNIDEIIKSHLLKKDDDAKAEKQAKSKKGFKK